MSEKRRDSKGRLLKTGESQRADGRYLYKYTDAGEAIGLFMETDTDGHNTKGQA